MSIIVLGEMLEELDANLIYRDLWQGGRPTGGHFLEGLGFKMVVLCAKEFQPPDDNYPGVEVVRAPFDDDPWHYPSKDTLETVVSAAGTVVSHLKSDGGPVLVSCWAGINRSGFVNAVTLHKLLGVPGEGAVRIVQASRSGALSNQQFVKAISKLRGK